MKPALNDKPSANMAQPAEYDLSRLLIIRALVLAIIMCVHLSIDCTISGFGCYKTGVSLSFLSAIFLTLLSYGYVRRAGDRSFFTALQLCLDALLITGIIYLTGGPISPFLFLYLPLVMATAVLCSRAVALGITFFSIVSYALLAWSMMSGRVLLLGPGDVVAPSGGLLLQILGLLCAMSLTAVGVTFLVAKVRKSAKLVEASKEEMKELSQRQKDLFNGINEGVITTDLQQAITSMNKAAASLLKISDEGEFIGRSMLQLLQHVGINGELPADGNPDRREIRIQSESGGHVYLACDNRPLQNAQGQQVGIISTFQDVTKLREVEEKLNMQERMARLLSQRDTNDTVSETMLSELVGETQLMRQIFRLIEKIGRNDASVIVTGESGTGKELAAKAIHASGPRASGPFVAVNCGAIPETLIESELFGHKKGSFTGADSDYGGLFRQADKGTIFLDEIGELPYQMQSKLLRVLQEKAVHPIGGDRDIPIDVRVIAATNRDLKAMVDAGEFREDLFYRLNVVVIKLPPLRKRKEDIPILINYFLKRLLQDEENAVISPQAMEILLEYEYPGNVRELENIIERAIVLGGSVILPEHLPEYVREPKSALHPMPAETTVIVDENLKFPIDLDSLLQTIERSYLEAALSRSAGVKKQAAGMLGMNFRSFRYRLQKYDLG